MWASFRCGAWISSQKSSCLSASSGSGKQLGFSLMGWYPVRVMLACLPLFRGFLRCSFPALGCLLTSVLFYCWRWCFCHVHLPPIMMSGADIESILRPASSSQSSLSCLSIQTVLDWLFVFALILFDCWQVGGCYLGPVSSLCWCWTQVIAAACPYPFVHMPFFPFLGSLSLWIPPFHS